MKFPISICYVATNIAQQSQKSISTYGQPRRMTELKIPVNLSCGIEVCTEIHDETNETLVDAMKRCFKKLPAHRVLIVALAEEISCDLILAVEEARGQRRPKPKKKRGIGRPVTLPAAESYSTPNSFAQDVNT